MKTKKLTIMALMATVIFLGGGTGWAAGPWFVKPSGNDANTCLSVATACKTINGAIGKAASGDTINVAAGTYIEAVNVDKSLTLTGAAGAKIKPDNLTPMLDGGVRRVAVYINGVDNVTVGGFEIDGTGGAVHIGIYGFNSNNTAVKNNVVHHMIDDPVNHNAGLGIIFYGWGQGIDDALIQGNTVSFTDHHGIWIGAVVSGGFPALVSTGNVIKGNTVHHSWQNLNLLPPGALWGGAIGMDVAQDSSIEGNSIHDTMSNQRDILLYGAYNVSIIGNTLLHSGIASAIEHASCFGGIYCASSHDLTITNNTITTTSGGDSSLVVFPADVGGDSFFIGNTVRLTGAPSNFWHGLALGLAEGGGPTGNWTIQNNTFDGNNRAVGGAGIRLFDDLPASSSINISCNAITGWDNGIKSSVLANAGLVAANFNSIDGNSLNGLLDSGSATAINAENNWWGNATGPSGVGAGTGDAVNGNVDFTPWLGTPPLCSLREVRRPGNINVGPDLGGTGHSALNFTGGAGPAGDTWITVLDGDFGTVSLSADVLIHQYNNTKGAGLLALYNEGTNKKGLALIIMDAGNTDSLQLGTIDQAGKFTSLKSVSLVHGILENVWYRLTMDVTVGAGVFAVKGTVFKHLTPKNPDSGLDGQVAGVGGTLNYPTTSLGSKGLDATGGVGIVARAISANVNSSVTNFTIGP